MIQVKKNQAKLYESIDAQFQEIWSKPEASQGAVKDKEKKSHRRLEQREAYVLLIKLDEKLLKKWPRIKTAIAIVRDRTVKGKTGSYTTSYYICTRAISASEALDIARKHWGVENKLHWILDITFEEDSSEVHDRIAAKNLASLRRFTMNILKITPLTEEKKKQRCLLKYQNVYLTLSIGKKQLVI